MDILRQARLEKGLSLRKLAELCKLDFRRLSEVERGHHLATRQMVKSLRSQLGESFSLPTRTPKSIKRWLRRLVPVRPYELRSDGLASWEYGERVYYQELQSMDAYGYLPTWFRKSVPCASADEVRLWYHLIESPADLILESPSTLGFRQLDLVDCRGRALGERKLPGIRLRGRQGQGVVWPQTWLRTEKGRRYCLDGLVLYRRRQGQIWCDLELDGPHHRPNRDRFRAQQLGLAEVRFRLEELDRGDLRQHLEALILSHWPGEKQS